VRARAGEGLRRSEHAPPTRDNTVRPAGKFYPGFIRKPPALIQSHPRPRAAEHKRMLPARQSAGDLRLRARVTRRLPRYPRSSREIRRVGQDYLTSERDICGERDSRALGMSGRRTCFVLDLRGVTRILND